MSRPLLIGISALLLLATTTDAFSPPRNAVSSAIKSKRPALLHMSAVDDTQIDTFGSIQDDGDLIAEESFDLKDTSLPSEEGIDRLLNQALAESVKSVRDVLPPELRNESTLNIMEDESFRAEIAQIFDKASLDLKLALDEIRKDQDDFAAESAVKSAVKTKAAMAQDQARLEQADKNMVKMIERVNRETEEVRKAVQELKVAQDNMSKDPIMQLASGGLVKQAALAGAILFTLRSGVDTLSMIGGDGSHAIPALLQGALALACAGYFFFVV